MVRDITSSGFTIVTGAKDEISGIAKYECYINGEKKGETEEETGAITISGLSPKISYDNIVVKVYNNAGLDEDTVPVSATTKDNICYTSYCSGGSSYRCSICNGTGTISSSSHGSWSYNGHATDSTKKEKNDRCALHTTIHGKGNKWSRTFFKCGKCGARYYASACTQYTFSLSEFQTLPSIYIELREGSSTCSGSSACSSCGGDGYIDSTCSHGSYSSHRYCSHYNNTSMTSHPID